MSLRCAVRSQLFRHQMPGLLLWLLAVGALPVLAQEAPGASDGPLQPSSDVARPHPIDNDTILRMAKAGIGDDVLVQTIRLQPGRYNTTPDALIELKSAGLSDRVIGAMQAYGTALNAPTNPAPGPGLHTRSAPLSTPAVPRADPVPVAPGIDEIGAYYKDQSGAWIELKTERVTFKSGGAAKSILTHGIISKDMNGHVDGAQSTLKVPPGTEILIYAPAGTSAEEYEFLHFREHTDNREFRTMTGGVFHSHTGSDRDSLEFTPTKIAPQMYTFTVPSDLEKGEYGVLPPGSSNIQGIAGTGKIFTFSIPE